MKNRIFQKLSTNLYSNQCLNKPNIRPYKKALLAVAVASMASAYAADGEFTVTTGRINNNAPQRIDDVTTFATQNATIMGSVASKTYLQNQKLADSSTFAARLIKVMHNRPFHVSPFLPVPARDINCYTDVPSYQRPLQFDVHATPVTVEADQVAGELGDKNQRANDLTYTGKVEIAQKDRVIDTDKAHYNSGDESFTTSGKSILRSGEYTVHTSEDVNYSLKDKIAKLKDTKFFFNGSVLRGTASEHEVNNAENSQTFSSGTLTTCPSGDNTWHLSASTVQIDRDEAFGDAWNVAVWAGEVPVFYLPYINFPITSERRSGLLYPTFSMGSEHVKFTQPIYFNLAPNYDWTFTPAWYGEHRWQFTNEFRFMPWENVSGQVLFNYLPNDSD